MNRYKYLPHGIVILLIPLLAMAAGEKRQSLYESVSHAVNDGNMLEILRKHGAYVITPFTLGQGEEIKCTEGTRRLAQTVELVLSTNKIAVYPLLEQERISLEEKCDQTPPKNLVLPPTVSSFIMGTLRPMDNHAALILRITDREGRERQRSMLSLDQVAELGIPINEKSQIPMASTSEVQQDGQSDQSALKEKVHELMKSADKTLLASKSVRYLQEAKALIGDNEGFDPELKEIEVKLRKKKNAMDLLSGDDYDF